MSRNVVGSIYGISSLKIAYFRPDPLANTVGRFLNIFPEAGGKMDQSLVGSSDKRPSIKIAPFVSIRKQTFPPQAILVSDWSVSKK